MGFFSSLLDRRFLPQRLFFLAVILAPLFFLDALVVHFEYHFSGNLMGTIIKGQWHIVIINIVIFLSFLVPLFFRRRVDWKEFSLVTAFFVSLFIEMYGIPLSVYFASRLFYGSGDGGDMAPPDRPVSFEIFGVGIGMTVPMVYGTVLMVIGTAIIAWGWITLYRGMKRFAEAGKKDAIVTDGIYSLSRHPQYLGFILVILGWLIGWPTLLVVIFAPLLIGMYIRVCIKEERELLGNTKDEGKRGSKGKNAAEAETAARERDAYVKYRKSTPFLV